jgi:basic amino acid/polyamine antiporter, APA family
MSGLAESGDRHIGLLGATGIGVGAIVGGGILALAGTAFAATGPSAILAFALNGVIAVLTALSFAEVASKFPQSGGTYAFAKKVLSVEAAFTVGWVVWFASIVAAVLYALGFGQFAAVAVHDA